MSFFTSALVDFRAYWSTFVIVGQTLLAFLTSFASYYHYLCELHSCHHCPINSSEWVSLCLTPSRSIWALTFITWLMFALVILKNSSSDSANVLHTYIRTLNHVAQVKLTEQRIIWNLSKRTFYFDVIEHQRFNLKWKAIKTFYLSQNDVLLIFKKHWPTVLHLKLKSNQSK